MAGKAAPLPYKGPLSQLQATALGIGTRRPKSRSMTHLGNRPSLLARVVREARSQEARVQVYAPPKPSCVTLEQQLSLFGLREREKRPRKSWGQEAALEKGEWRAPFSAAAASRTLLSLPLSPPSTKLASEDHVAHAEQREGRGITKELDTPLARPVSAEPCFPCPASHGDCFFMAAWSCGVGVLRCWWIEDRLP